MKLGLCFLLFVGVQQVVFAIELKLATVLGDRTGADDGEYSQILRDALEHVSDDSDFLGIHRIRLELLGETFNSFWQSMVYVCSETVVGRSVTALVLPEDVCDDCDDLSATISYATDPIINLDPGSLESPAIQMYPSPEDVNSLLKDMLQYYKWVDFTLLYDNGKLVENLSPLLSEAKDYGWNIRLLPLSDDFKETADAIKYDRLQDVNNIILYTFTEEVALDVIKKGITHGIVSKGFHWMIANIDLFLERGFIEELRYTDAFITRFNMNETDGSLSTTTTRQRTKYEFRQRLAFDSALATGHALRLYRMDNERADGTNPFEVDNEIVVNMPRCSVEPQSSALKPYFSKIDFKGMSGRVAFNEDGHRVNYRISVTSGIGDTLHFWRGEWIQNPSYDPYGVVSQSNENSDQRLRMNPYFQAEDDHLVISMVEVAPYVMTRGKVEYLSDDEKGAYDDTVITQQYSGNERYEGFLPELMKYIQDILQKSLHVNIDYRLQVFGDAERNYGTKDIVTGEWNGMLKEVLEGEADVAAGPLVKTAEREADIDFTIPFLRGRIHLLVKHPNHIHDYAFNVMYPLGVEVWFIALVVMFFVAALLFAYNHYNPNEWRSIVERDSNLYEGDAEMYKVNADNFNIRNSIWFAVTTIFLQSYDASPRSHAGRILAAFWWFFALITVFLYGMHLSSFLMFNKQFAHVRTVHELLQKVEIDVGLVQDAPVYSYLKASSSSSNKALFNLIATTQPSPMVRNIQDGVERVRQLDGEYSIVEDYNILNFFTRNKPCDVFIGEQSLDRFAYAMATKSGSPVRDQFTYAIEKLSSNGTIEKLEKKWLEKEGKCSGVSFWEKEGLWSLTLVDLQGAYYLLLIGIGCTLTMLFLDLVAYLLCPTMFQTTLRERDDDNQRVPQYEQYRDNGAAAQRSSDFL
ncbi:glutamate receptor 2-like [Anneissia japonica]|uniref:glutamate receptor 2-like n=1 Tax=Anneissia japonica TaxID=1529436 RepID=UPI0014257DB6|nr:glutamate receptor 2-like [Anneissia japonica]